jgi:hypothetical protein
LIKLFNQMDERDCSDIVITQKRTLKIDIITSIFKGIYLPILENKDHTYFRRPPIKFQVIENGNLLNFFESSYLN